MRIPIKVFQSEEKAEPLEGSERALWWCEKISKISLYALVFLIPLFFLPWTANILDFNKQALLGILALVSFLCWLIKVLVSGKLELVWDKTWLAISAFIGLYGFSTLFSLWRQGSFWGWPLTVHAGFLTVLSLAIFYFLAVNIFRTKEEALRILMLLAFSGTMTGIIGILQLFGKFFGFNTIGTVNALGVFLAALFPILFVLSLYFGRFLRAITALFAIIVFSVLVFINFWIAWVALIAGASLLYIFGILNIKAARQTSLVSLPISILVIAIFFLFFNFRLPGLPAAPPEVSPSYRAEFGIIKEAFKDLGIKRMILGTGPGTFAYDYSRFKPVTINQTIFWNTRFGAGASDILDRLLTTGVLGLSAFLAVFLLFWKNAFNDLREKVGREEERLAWILTLGAFSGFTAAFVALAFYPANLSLMFLFWAILASLGILGSKNVKSWQLEPSSYAMVAMSTVLVMVIISGAGLSLIGAQKYFAEVEYLRGIRLSEKGNLEGAIAKMISAANFNVSQDNYWRDLSQLYLARANQIIGQGGEAGAAVSNAVTAATRSTELNPANVANWSVRGFVYRQLIGLVGGADKWAEESYKKAIELEPSNPYLHTELGIVYALRREFDPASKSFERALELKPDYTPAITYLEQVKKGSKPQPPVQTEKAPEQLKTK